MKNIGIIGLGLIGGSLGIALKKQKFKVFGFDHDQKNAETAKNLSLVDDILSADEMLKVCEVVVVATPTSASISIIQSLLKQEKEDQLILDVGSTKHLICEALKNVENRRNFVAAHPIAGTENSGPSAAIENLFHGKTVVICEEGQSSTLALAKAEAFFTALNCSLVYMNSDDHDKHLAYISHLSHVCSFALGLTVLDIEKDEKNIFNLAGSGFASTARLAKSSPAMWEPILIQNKSNLIPAIDAYLTHLINLKNAIENEDTEGLRECMMKANEIRAIIKN